jgi:putative peptidoglycan lipid II flippase
MGLAVASDIGIAMQTLTIAVLLHQRHMVSLASLDFAEMGRCLAAAVASGVAVWFVFTWLGGFAGHFLGSRLLAQIRWIDLAELVAGSALWLVVVRWVLEITGSALPRVMMRRLKMG